jgi:hypothetical protein
MAVTIHEWVKDLAPVVVSIAVLWVTISFNRWQGRLAKQKLRHDLYERRMAVYIAFRDLLIALPEKGDEEIKASHRKASIARFEASFLFDDPNLPTYLEDVCKQVSDKVIANATFLEVMRNQTQMNDPQMIQDFARRAAQLGEAKIEIPDRHLKELSRQFGPSLKLSDFWKG